MSYPVQRMRTGSEEEAIGGDTDYKGTSGHIERVITAGGHPVDNSQPAFPVYHRRFANPAPLGLMSFAGTTLVLSLYNLNVRDIHTPNVVLGLALGYGGLCQTIAGIQEWACGNTFGAASFSSYGAFWLSFAVLYIPQFGVLSAYTSLAELSSALAIYLTSWAIITFIFMIAALRSSVALLSIFFLVDLLFILQAAGYYIGSTPLIHASGVVGILLAADAMYVAAAGLLTKDTSYFQLPVGDLSGQKKATH